jgi:transposase
MLLLDRSSLARQGRPRRSGEDNRRFVETVLRMVRAEPRWRDLPDAFGQWGSVWKRFRRQALKGVFERIFAALSEDPESEYALIDGAIVKVQRARIIRPGDPSSSEPADCLKPGALAACC